MINILKLIGRLSNGISFASYELDALTYRAEPIKQRQSVIIPALKKGMVQVVDLDNFLKFNLLVTGIDMDLAEDDNKELKSDGKSTDSTAYGLLYVNVINRKTKDVIKKLVFQISSYPAYLNEIILSPEYIYEFKPSKDVNSITLTGEPVHLREALIFKDSVYKPK